ncbi:integrin alpha [uncultured Sphingomonas sp.]|uniref:integrin alpha n=1 Tax=uncultured Sphingomonas sp. TaxID=158754 RepID=UPI0035CC8F56
MLAQPMSFPDAGRTNPARSCWPISACGRFRDHRGRGIRLTGYGVGSAGDINGDGFADLLVGAPRLAQQAPVSAQRQWARRHPNRRAGTAR